MTAASASSYIAAYSPLDSERGRIDVDLLGLDAKDLAGTAGNPGKQLGQIVGLEPIQGTSQTVIVEHLGSNI
jgi:hypothetical protein